MKKTPFYEKLKNNNAKMVEFCDYEMPMQFEGIVKEHKTCREGVGLFDVSHMAEFLLKGETALESIENIATNDIKNLEIGKARYSLMLNKTGGVIDDIIVYRLAESEFMIVANASNYEKDLAHIKANRLVGTRIKDITERTALLALQGREAEGMLLKIFDKKSIPDKAFTFKVLKYKGGVMTISRTGYTGEDGFEIYLNSAAAEDFFDTLIEASKGYNFAHIGLGARDTLRLEAAMPLYGHEMDETTLASELGLSFAIKPHLKDFIGKKAILDNEPEYKRQGIILQERGIARENMKVFSDNEEIGYVTSGTQSPTLGKPIAMIRVLRSFEGDMVEVEIRNKRIKAKVVNLPFYSRFNK